MIWCFDGRQSFFDCDVVVLTSHSRLGGDESAEREGVMGGNSGGVWVGRFAGLWRGGVRLCWLAKGK